MDRRRLIAGIALLAALVAGLLLWWLTPEPAPTVEQEIAARAVRRPVRRVLEGVTRPIPSQDAVRSVLVDGEDRPRPEERVDCAIPDMPQRVPVQATARGGGAEIAVMAVAVEGGIQLGGLQTLRKRLADAARAPVGDLIGLVAYVEGMGEVQLRVRGEGEAWRCQVTGVEPVAWVEGTVTTRRGLAQRRVTVRACGRGVVAEMDGSFTFRVPLEEDGCLVVAERQDGAFERRSDPVAIHPVPGTTTRVSLDLPDDETGGVGVQIRRHDLGIRIARVLPDSPAEDAGLTRRDIVVAVDGIPAVDLDEAQFQDAAVGPAGTDVVYTVLREGKEVEVVMVREPRDR